MSDRPFDSYSTSITDPTQFFGRSDWLEKAGANPFNVWVLLGGRRLGKTSALRALEYRLMSQPTGAQAFPIFIPLELNQPRDLNHFRFVLLDGLRQAVDRWRGVDGTALATSSAAQARSWYQGFLSRISEVKVTWGFIQATMKPLASPETDELSDVAFRETIRRSLDELRELGYGGACFLLDEVEFVVRNQHANEIFSYLRGLKDSSSLKSQLGLVLSGYRGVSEYEQKIGSKLLEIAKLIWLECLTEDETRKLAEFRMTDEDVPLDQSAMDFILKWGGLHPFLTQQILNAMFDDQRNQGRTDPDALKWTPDALKWTLMEERQAAFRAWWNADGLTDGFQEREREVYLTIQATGRATVPELVERLGRKPLGIRNSLRLLSGTGVIRRKDDDSYETGSLLFSEWVAQMTE
jgi:hypothetical protein